MSTYGDDENGRTKNNLNDEMVSFLENHPVSELLEMVAYAVRYAKEWE